jgi:ornithine cyclodeaminase/alanine dehydrogenase
MSIENLAALSRAEVARRLPPIREQVAIAARTFQALSGGRVEMPPKTGIHPRDDTFIHAMPCYLEDEDVAAIKWVSGYPDNPSRGLPYISGLIVLNDPATGVPRTILDAAEITAARTAAASGLCVEAFAPDGWSRAAILGCGEQGRYHADVFRCLNPACEIVGYDPVPERVPELCDGAIVATDPIEAVADADIIVTAGPIVKDPTPALLPEALPETCLLLPIDFDFYFDPSVVRGAERFVVDDIEQFEYYRSLGYFEDWVAPSETLGEAIGRPGHGGGRVLCANLGIGALDAAFANAVLRSDV